MNKHLLTKAMLLLFALVVGSGSVWGQEETFSKTYSYGESTWSRTNFEDATSYYKSSSSTASVASIAGIFTKKAITSDVTITLNVATFGTGSNPTKDKFGIYNSAACTTQVTATQSGTLPTSSTYTNVVYTVTKDNAASFTNDLAVQIASGTKQIRLKSIKVEFKYTEVATPKYTVTFTAAATNGTLAVKNGDDALTSGDEVEENTVLTIVTTPDTNYRLQKWQYKTDGAWTDGVGSTYTVTSNVELQALFEEKEKYTVTYSDGGSDTEATVGGGVTLPVRSNPAGSTFRGWSETEITSATTTVPTILTGTYTPDGNTTLYPVYSYETKNAVSKSGWEEIFTVPEDGTYAICTDTYFLKAALTTTSTKRFQNGDATPSIEAGKLTVAPAADCIWEIYKEDSYWRIKNGDNFAAGGTSKNSAQFVTTSVNDYAKWTITYETDKFVLKNKGRSESSSDPGNCYLRNNTTSGWAPYTVDYGTAPRLFKKVDGVDEVAAIYYVSSVPATSTTLTIADGCTDGTKYYATFSSQRAFAVPADLTVSAIKVTDGKLNLMTYTEGQVVAANTGVMVAAATAGDKTLTFSTADATVQTGNMLVATGADGITAAAMNKADTKFYRLTMADGKPGFWWKSEGGAGFDLAGNKAYLAVPAAVAARGFSFDDSETTGISDATRLTDNGEMIKDKAVYNLNGQRVNNGHKGIVIVNGKKFVLQ